MFQWKRRLFTHNPYYRLYFYFSNINILTSSGNRALRTYRKIYIVVICTYCMVNKTISIPWEVNEKLKLEANASGLISELLIKHYAIDPSVNIDIQETEDKINNLKHQVETAKFAKEEEERDKQEAEDLIKKKREEKIANFIKSVKDLYEQDITEQDAIEYLDGDYENINQYAREKGFIRGY